MILKTSKKNRKQQTLHFAAYPDPKLCVLSCLKHYITRTEHLEVKTKHKLFIVTRKPYRTAARSTVARWIKEALWDAGIDTVIYTAHSTWKFSTSTANASSLPIGTILRAAGWRSDRVFAGHYRLPVRDHSSFVRAVLDQPATRPQHTNLAGGQD